MIPRDVQPVEHRSPYKPIDLRGTHPATPVDARSIGLEAVAAVARSIEGERIWKLVRQTAEGCNAPTRENAVVTDGWDAA